MATNDRLKQLHRQATGALARGDLNGAAQACRQMLAVQKSSAEAHGILSEICLRSGRFDEAREHWARVVKQAPKHAPHRVRLGQIELRLGRVDAALAQMEEAYRLDPDAPSSVLGLASTLELKGRQDRARALLERHARTLPPHAGIAALRARLLIHDRDHDEAVRLGTEFLESAEAGRHPEEARDLCFSVAEAHEKAGRFDEAFAWATRGNAMGRVPFDPAQHAALTDALIDTFSKAFLRDAPRAGGDTSVPVFIVGMPRSGSSLVEQIIDAHPEAHGAGELSDLEVRTVYMAREIGSSRPYPQCVVDLTAESVASQSRRYLERLIARAPRATRITDKLLVLFRHCGLMQLLFPQARIIHVRRDPIDTCLACYMSRLVPRQLPFTTDLAHLGHAWRDCARLMAHWRETLDLPILEVDYETLVRDQEAETRRIVAFLDLPWNDACLRFHESKRGVTTLSTAQVRRPMYTSSIGRAERYAAHLGPLREALGASAGG